MIDEELKKKVIEDVVLLKLVGFKPIIVHGGGKEISKWVDKVGMETHFVNGLRVTDVPTMEIAEMVLNRVNKSLVSLVQNLGVEACGISGKDGEILKVTKKLSNGEDIGFVGEVNEVNPKLILDLIENDFLPVICPVGTDENGNSYNVNADDAACAIAKAVKAEKLAFLTDIEGVYRDKDDPGTLISELDLEEAHPRQEAQAHLLPTQQRKRKLPQPLPYGLHQRIRQATAVSGCRPCAISLQRSIHPGTLPLITVYAQRAMQKIP